MLTSRITSEPDVLSSKRMSQNKRHVILRSAFLMIEPGKHVIRICVLFMTEIAFLKQMNVRSLE